MALRQFLFWRRRPDPEDDEDSDDNEQSSPEEKSEEEEPPNPPEPPLRPNNFYIREKFRDTAIDMGPCPSSHVLKALNEKWLRLPPQERKPYLEKAKIDSLRYAKELQVYRAKWATCKKDPDARPPKRKTKPSYHPKRPQSVLQMFIRKHYLDYRRDPQNRNAQRREILKQMKIHWIQLREEEREPYKQMHDQDVRRFEKEMVVYQTERFQTLRRKQELVERLKNPDSWAPSYCRQQ